MGNTVRMRNKRTGEVRDVDDASQEFKEMKAEVGPAGNIPWTTQWEQQGDHFVDALAARAESGDIRDEDLGHDAHPIILEREPGDAAADPSPHLSLTPAEVDMGLTLEEKTQQLADQRGGEAYPDANREERESLTEKIKASVGSDSSSGSSSKRSKSGGGAGGQTGRTGGSAARDADKTSSSGSGGSGSSSGSSSGSGDAS